MADLQRIGTSKPAKHGGNNVKLIFFAALSVEAPACHSQICKMALRTAVRFLNHDIEKDPQDDEKNQLLKKRRLLVFNSPTKYSYFWLSFTLAYLN